jgi:hypothetical protein
MKQIAIAVLLLSAFAGTAVAKTHRDVYDIPCTTLWPAVKDTLRNSGKYGIVGIDNTEMTASYNIGGTLTAKRTNSVVLNAQGDKCEMQVQSAFAGWTTDDAGDFKKRVDASLAKLKAAPPAEAPKQDAPPPNGGDKKPN